MLGNHFTQQAAVTSIATQFSTDLFNFTLVSLNYIRHVYVVLFGKRGLPSACVFGFHLNAERDTFIQATLASKM